MLKFVVIGISYPMQNGYMGTYEVRIPLTSASEAV